MEEVIQAYEKIHLEKSNVQRDLDKMVNTHTDTHTLFGGNTTFVLSVEQPFVLEFHRNVCVFQTSLAEQHVEQICGLESALRQRETSLQKLSVQLRSKDAHKSHLQLHASLDVPRGGFCAAADRDALVPVVDWVLHVLFECISASQCEAW